MPFTQPAAPPRCPEDVVVMTCQQCSSYIKMSLDQNTNRDCHVPLHRSNSDSCQVVQATNTKRKKHVRYEIFLLVSLLLVLGGCLAVLSARHPQLWRQVVSPGPAVTVPSLDPFLGQVTATAGGEWWQGGERGGERVARELWGEFSRRCSSSPGAGGTRSIWGMEEALCLLTETKVDLDARTKNLDEEVYKNNKQVENLIPSRARKKNVSVVYSTIPSIHLSPYYSHEFGQAQDADRFEPLRWTYWQSGLSSLREIDVTKEGDVIINIRVKHPGYYYVYSQVTFDLTKAASWTRGRFLHCVYKNYGREAGALPLVHSPPSAAPVSSLQGLFPLRAGDTLTVLARSRLMDTVTTEGTFFGAYRV